MPRLNPFLRALFSSSVLSSALTAQNYVLLVPSTDSLINATDQDTQKRYTDLCEDEDFLGAHILRISPEAREKENAVRESRSKAKTYTTVNNRTLVIKDQSVFTQKGFKNVVQAQMLHDQLYQSPVRDDQWLVIYISRPLVGVYERVNLVIPLLDHPKETTDEGTGIMKKDVQTFSDLLNQFSKIAQQMQPGLERVFNEFAKELGKPLPPPPSRSPTTSVFEDDRTTLAANGRSASPNGSIGSASTMRLPFNSGAYFEDEEDVMRRALETAVTATIDLFQGVDKQQLSLVGATTDLTGPMVERLIERYVAENIHDKVLFPRLCAFHRPADHDLDKRIRQMSCLDVSQVGIDVQAGRSARRELMTRVDRGVLCFRKMGVAGSPQQMLDCLLETQKLVSQPGGNSDEEKAAAAMTINADVLVSLLLIVVVRSGVRRLQARLSYMQRFIFIDDVECGEMGYALSTLEAVLAYLASDAGGLRKTSKQNERLWKAVRTGDLNETKNIFEQGDASVVVEESDSVVIEVPLPSATPARPALSRGSTRSNLSVEFLATNGVEAESPEEVVNGDGDLSHVFPFQKSNLAGANGTVKGKQKKRVKLNERSMSISSSMSLLSRTATLESTLSGIEGDMSLGSLAQTTDSTGNSVLMMAIDSQEPRTLNYLLTLDEHYSVQTVIDDANSDGTTLLSAAIQLPSLEMANIILDFIEAKADSEVLRSYLNILDNRGRSCAHYLFSTPSLIKRLERLIPWRLKDKLGQTPLFSICRSYDSANYSAMVLDALIAARRSQGDGKALSLSEHIDNKNNSLLHILNDPFLTHKVLHYCNVDPNCMNDRRFTPLMLASKYGRVDVVRIFFGDPRVDLYLREARGLTAVELAKDDEVRNRIDDLTLFSELNTRIPDSRGRLTAIVRSFFVEDATTRFIIKSGAPHTEAASNTYTITTSRRSSKDFQQLIKWLTADNPSSYLPFLHPNTFRSPFQIHSKPSRALLHFSQVQLDRLLKVLLTHPTFSTHEVLWEFFLVPDMQPPQIEARSQLKASLLRDRINEDYGPLTTSADLEATNSVIMHSHDVIRKQQLSLAKLVRRGHVYQQSYTDLSESLVLAADILRSLGPPSTSLPTTHIHAFDRYIAQTFTEPQSSPLVGFIHAQTSLLTTTIGLSHALKHPNTLVNEIRDLNDMLIGSQKLLARESKPRSGIISLAALEQSRVRSVENAAKKIVNIEAGLEKRGRELRYASETVMDELAGWTTWREDWAKREIKAFVRASVIKERERLKCMQRVLDTLKHGK